MEKFKTIDKEYQEQIIEKKSKFIANIYYVENVQEAEDKIKQIKKKYFDAKHNCFAYIVADDKNEVIQRFSDDKEPSGTAGAPILNILVKMQICNVLVVVTRYFGGILLGTGGLVRAYSEATMKALENANFIEMEKGDLTKIQIEYNQVENFKYYCRKNNIKIIKENYLNFVEIFCEISKTKWKKMEKDKMKLEITKIDKICEKYIKID